MKKKIFIIAGENSGDTIGELLVKELKKREDLEFLGIAGPKMQNSGVPTIFPMSEISFMGFFEILPHIFKLRERIKQTINEIKKFNPDIIITVDSPGFTYRIASKIKTLTKAKLIHIVAPSVWAYAPERAEKYAKVYDLLLTLFDFEPKYFENHGLKSVFTGHFLFEQNLCNNNLIFRNKYNISPHEKLLCMTPGSRSGEIQMHLPIFLEAIAKIEKKLTFKLVILAASEPIKEVILEKIKSYSLKTQIIVTTNDKFEAYKASDLALAKSGTNTLEISLHKTPLIIAYKIQWLSWFFIKLKAKIKFANLINIIAGKEIIPELLQKNCNSDSIANEIIKLLIDNNKKSEQISAAEKILDSMKNKLGKASEISANEIIKLLR